MASELGYPAAAGSPVAEHARRRSAEQMGLTCALLDLLAEWDRDVQAVRVQFEPRRAAVCTRPQTRRQWRCW